MTKREISKYGEVSKNLSKNHSVGDAVWSEESFVEGFNQAVQMLEPDSDMVQCPKCNTTSVVMNNFVRKDALQVLQYPAYVDANFLCYKCRHEFVKQLKLSPVQP